MDLALMLLVAIIILGLAFEFVNGFHDAPNALALPVGEAVMVAPATSSDPARSVLLRDLAAPPGIDAASAVVVSG